MLPIATSNGHARKMSAQAEGALLSSTAHRQLSLYLPVLHHVLSFTTAAPSLSNPAVSTAQQQTAIVFYHPAGEINTLQGNLNWVASREHELTHPIWSGREEALLPLTSAAQSDSANLDNVAELLVRQRHPPEHAYRFCTRNRCHMHNCVCLPNGLLVIGCCGVMSTCILWRCTLLHMVWH